MEIKQNYSNAYYQCAKQTIEEFMKSKENEIENSYVFSNKDGNKYKIRIKLSFEVVH